MRISSFLLLIFTTATNALHEWTNETMNDLRADSPCVSPGSCVPPQNHKFSNVASGTFCRNMYNNTHTHARTQVQDQDFNGISMVDFVEHSVYVMRI